MRYQKIVDFAVGINSRYAWAACFVVVYVSSFILSGVSAPLSDLDPSYQLVLEYARAHDFQFGKDIVFTFGPLGFLNTWVSQGLFPVQRILFALAWSGVVSWSVIGLARQIPGPLKFIFLVWFLVYSNTGWLEQHASLVMAYGCIVLMGDVRERKSASLIFLTFFAFLALIKFTFFMVVVVSIIVCALVQIGKRNYMSTICMLVYFGAIFVFLWIAAGQKCVNLLPWVRGSYEIAAGYTEAMTLIPKTGVLIACTIAGAMYLISLVVIIRSVRLHVSSVGILAVTSAYVFLSWKHGFVRADGHVMSFIFFLPLAYSVLLSDTFQKTMVKKPRLYLASLFLGAVILCNWAADFQEPGIMLTKLICWPQNMVGNSRHILNAVSGRWENSFEALRSGQQSERIPDLPVVRTLIGRSSVDVVNYEQWAALANNLNYRPRPVIQGYSAYTPYLQDLNLSFYQSNKRPQYVLFNMESIDRRFPALDDAPVLLYLLNNYKPVAKEGGFLVLRASPGNFRDARPVLIHEQKIAFGEELDLSAYKNRPLIMRVSIQPTFVGRIIKFLFQSPVLAMNTRMNGKLISYRFISSMADRGFVVSPLLLTNKDVNNYYDGATVGCADTISFSAPEYASIQLNKTITVRLYMQRNSIKDTL